MNELDNIIADIHGIIEASIEGFNASTPAIEKEIFKNIELTLKDLDLKNGRVIPSAKNLRSLKSIKKEIDSVVLTDKYKLSVKEFTDTFEAVAALQNEYFSAMVKDFSPQGVSKALLEASVESTVDGLTESGITSNIANGVRDVLKANMTGRGSYSDMVEQTRKLIISSEGNDGIMASRARQITTDSLNQFSAEYNQLITSDLNLEWYRYTGSLKPTSRQFCESLIKKKWIHISEIPEIVDCKIDGKVIPKNPKTGLWYGARKDTTKDTFFSWRGGWNCNHQLIGTVDSFVPKEIRIALYTKTGNKKKLSEIN